MAISIAMQIRKDFEDKIISGAWPPGARVPYEHALVAQYGCSRMTVSKVLNDLSARGLIVRRRRAGSFVAEPSVERSLLEIEDFAATGLKTGRSYEYILRQRRVRKASASERKGLNLPPDARLLELHCSHLLAGIPVASEKRLIVLDTVPDAELADFDAVPPGSWLLRHVPWTQAEHVIGAVNATLELAAELDIPDQSACLELHRRTWFRGAIVTDVLLVHPGRRYQLSGRFSPEGTR